MPISANPQGARDLVMSTPTDGGENVQCPLTNRQSELDYYWRFFRCANYDHYTRDWNGAQFAPRLEREQIASAGFIPTGMGVVDTKFPYRYRRPIVPYYLAQVIVNRFTSLLFSESKRPRILCDDELTEDWLVGFADATSLWTQMSQARTYGGAMGAVAVGFEFKNGKPFVQVHDPRWVFPTFSDRSDYTLSRIEKRFQYPVQERDEEGEWKEVLYWYRRVIDEETDSIWDKVRATPGEPEWDVEEHRTVNHGLGFCPVVWIQNRIVEDATDGDPDCFGVYETIEAMDRLYSQAYKGTIQNADPTTVVKTEEGFQEVTSGSDYALQMGKDEDIGFLEMQGTGIKQAIELAEKFEEKALTIARCYLDTNTGGPSRTEEEIQHNHSSMLEAASSLRTQYGKGLQKLLELVLQAARMLSQPRKVTNEDGTVSNVVSKIALPKKKIKNSDGKVTGFKVRELGEGESVEIQWPKFMQPTLDQISKAVDAASKARSSNLIDNEHATRFVAEYFKVESVRDVIANVRKEDPMNANMGPSEGDGAEPGAPSEGGGGHYMHGRRGGLYEIRDGRKKYVHGT
jgi:hypothetical protein